ncbi:MAG: hypothetical protein P8N13_09580 [Ilumatobacter sp.]|nr:hypothetical protein [Ilumatobacter sp.]
MPEMFLEEYVRQLSEILSGLCGSSGSLFLASPVTVAVERDGADGCLKLEVIV